MARGHWLDHLLKLPQRPRMDQETKGFFHIITNQAFTADMDPTSRTLYDGLLRGLHQGQAKSHRARSTAAIEGSTWVWTTRLTPNDRYDGMTSALLEASQVLTRWLVITSILIMRIYFIWTPLDGLELFGAISRPCAEWNGMSETGRDEICRTLRQHQRGRGE